MNDGRSVEKYFNDLRKVINFTILIGFIITFLITLGITLFL